jgi:ABC-type lipoprotein export system ATPase subunit
MVIIQDMKFGFNDGDLINISSWTLGQGEHCLFLGNSGSGKTTLLHLLAGLIRPNKGNISISGTELTQLSSTKLDRFRGRNIGLIFQSAHLIDVLSVKDNLLLTQYLADLPKDVKRIEEVLNELNIGHKLNARVYELSQGEMQRVTIARALLNKPKLLLADEPTSSLDDENCEVVVSQIIRQAEKNNATLIISTHDGRIKSRFQHHLKLGKS